ncbi:MAG: hypothetical protein JO141_19265 [Bradyrhizobium sp.]|nr:hypothetical protein [Bradyrhizobium sp.]
MQYFVRECLPSQVGQIPLAVLFRGDRAASVTAEPAEAVPPRSFRHIILDEWAAFTAG